MCFKIIFRIEIVVTLIELLMFLSSVCTYKEFKTIFGKKKSYHIYDINKVSPLSVSVNITQDHI